MSAMNETFSLEQDAWGRWIFTGSDGIRSEDVTFVRAFPISSADDGIGILGRNGREVAWIPRLADVPDQTRHAVEQALAGREFMPEIQQVIGISGFAAPCDWHVMTDRGETRFTLKAEEDIRRMAPPCLMIIDKRGIQYLVRDPKQLDAYSRKVFERFL